MKNFLKTDRRIKIDKILANEIDPAFYKRAEVILTEATSRDPEKILDVGCGRGFYSNALGSLCPSSRVWGVDKSKKYLESARKHSPKNVRYLHADAASLPFPDNCFDVVICSELLEHVTDDALVAFEVARVTKRGGKVLVSVPSANYPFLWDPLNWILERTAKKHVRKNIWWLAGIWADHRRLYREEEILELVKTTGLEVKRVVRVVRWCIPGSHFLLYGIGKNLAEKIFFGKYSRFESGPELPWYLKMVRNIFFAPERLDRKWGANKNTAFQGIVVSCEKK